jgi:gliding motility-associated-like protein
MRKILRGHVFNINLLFTLCLGFAFSATHAQVSGTFTINSALPAALPNFKTFTAAAAYLSGGVNGPVIFNVQTGGYFNEQLVLNTITGTSATNTITFNGNGATLEFLSTNTLSRAVVKIKNTSWVTINNLNVIADASGGGEYGYGFHLLNNADHNTIINCTITNNLNFSNPELTTGIVINGNDENPLDPGTSNCDDNLIQNNTIQGSGIGITLSSEPVSGAPVYMNANKLVKNTINNWYANAIEVYYNSNAQIDGNEFISGWENYWSCAIHLGGENHKVAVINNRIRDMIIDPSYSANQTFGIRCNSTSVAGQENLIANNAMYNWESVGAQYGITSLGGSFINIYNNTISLDDQNNIGDTSRGVYLLNVSDVNLMNNIVTVTRKTAVENYGMYVSNDTRLTSDHNVFYVPMGNAPVSVMGLYNGNFQNKLSDWILTTGNDRFSLDLNPGYVNSGAGNLAPTLQVIDNMAVYVNLTTDINANPRSTTSPDPGCFEFTSAACAAVVTTGSTIIGPDSVICQGPKVAMSLKGNSAGNGQTYTWQTSTTQFGTYTNVSAALNNPYFEVTPNASLYYRAAVACGGGGTAFSSPIKVLVTSPLNGGTYTINNTLPTGGVNFNSFNDAVRSLNCGFTGNIVFNVASGTGPYQEQLIIPAVATAPNRTITFNGNGNTITYPTTTAKRSVVKLDGADYITIDSLNIVVQGATNGFGYGIIIMNDADNNTIKRCTINVNNTSISGNYVGIAMSANEIDPASEVANSFNDNNLIANNKVIGGYYGITCVSNSDYALPAPLTTGNIIRNNKITDNCGFGMFIAGTGNVLIDSNDISVPTRTIFAPPYEGIHISKLNRGLKVTRNRIHNLMENAKSSILWLSGIQCKGVQGTAAEPNMISNNLLYNYWGLGIHEGLYALSSQYVKFYHNSVSLTDTTSGKLVAGDTRGFGYFGNTSVGIELKDNNLVILRGGTQGKYCIFLNFDDSALVADNNNYYVHSVGTNAYVGSMNGVLYPTLTSWLATRKDANSINIDPVYNDLAKGDLTPTKILFENRGANVGITTDVFNATRNTTKPDIGAIEFTICSPLTTPILDVLDSTTNFIKFGWSTVANTTGYRVSRDNLNWTIPSSGALGTTHTVTGLKPTDKITLWVKALGTRADCPEYLSNQREGSATTDGIFVPNTFTPNNDNRNDKFKVYSAVTRSVHWMVFNQWGEKVFESNEIMGEGWDGIYKGKPQPIGVYVYVVSGVLLDGTKVTKKGSFNLVR